MNSFEIGRYFDVAMHKKMISSPVRWIVVNSIFNGARMADVWLDQYLATRSGVLGRRERSCP
jgi:hypothetical protein